MADSTDSPTLIGPHASMTQYLTRRVPAALFTDAFVLFIVYILVHHTWFAIYQSTDPVMRTKPADTFLQAFASMTGLLWIVSTFFLGLSIGLAAWALARQLSSSKHNPS